MSTPEGVAVTVPEVGPETWVATLGDRWVAIRFWAASGPASRRPHPPFVTLHDPNYERRLTPDDLDQYADTLRAAAAHQRSRYTEPDGPAEVPGQLSLDEISSGPT